MMTSARCRGAIVPLLPAFVLCCTLVSSTGTAAPSSPANANDSSSNHAFSAGPTGLVLLKTVDRGWAAPGDTLTYTLVYFNNSGATVSAVTILDALPATVQFLDASAGGALPGNAVVWSVGDLRPGDSGAVSFRARVTGGLSSGMLINNQALMATGAQGIVADSNIVTTTVTTPIAGVGFTGTYKLIVNAANPTSITVDPQNHFTVATVAGDGKSLGEGAQGTLNPDGSFRANGINSRASFTGQIDPLGQMAVVTVQRNGLTPYTVTLPRTPSFSTLPGALVGTFLGSATNPAGDRLQVLLTIDPEGNSTFQGDLTLASPNHNFRTGSYQVTPGGQLGFNGQMDGMVQPETGSLLLTYQWIGHNYRSTFHVLLIRQE
jgi:uncharacterized repeat protein (TIGR01451 family)